MTAQLSLAIVIASGVLYHLAQKTAPTDRPWPMLAIAYGAGFVLALVLAITDTSGDSSGGPKLGRAGGTGLLLGLAAFGIEVGVFYVYRTGWPLATASVVANIAVTAVLATVGVLVFGEHLTAVRIAGIVLALAGGILIVRGSGGAA